MSFEELVIQSQKKLQKQIETKLNPNITISCKGTSLQLTGEVTTWKEYISLGELAAKYPCKEIVNDICVKGITIPSIKAPKGEDSLLHNKTFDVLIIGGGIIGSAIARTLSKWNLKVALLEKEEDLAIHASGRNDGIIHAGIAPKSHTLKSQMNSRGNYLYTEWADELGFTIERPGTLIAAQKLWYKPCMQYMFHKRLKHIDIPAPTYLSAKEVKRALPNLETKTHGAYLFSNTGIISPYRATIAMGEHAIQNGVEFYTNSIVIGMEKEGDSITRVKTNRGYLSAKLVINAAGMWSDTIAEYADDRFFSLHPRKGNMIVLNKKHHKAIPFVVSIPDLFSKGQKSSKGGAILPTVDNNLLLGPDAFEYPFREDYSIDKEKEELLFLKYQQQFPMLEKSDILKTFSGIRAATWKEDFIIEQSEKVKNLIHVAGIQSPGVAAAPAIAERVETFVESYFKNLTPNTTYNPKRLNTLERESITITPSSQNSSHESTIICSCEGVTQKEIEKTLQYQLTPQNYNMIRKRTRCGHGTCGGKMCKPRIENMLKNK